MRSITNGLDWKGRVCGKTPAVADYPYMALPNPANYEVRVCVNDCAKTATNDPTGIVENLSFMVVEYTTTKRASAFALCCCCC